MCVSKVFSEAVGFGICSGHLPPDLIVTFMKELLGKYLSPQKALSPSYYYYLSFRWTSESQTRQVTLLPSELHDLSFGSGLVLSPFLACRAERKSHSLPLTHLLPPLSVPFRATGKSLLHHNWINSRACPGLSNRGRGLCFFCGIECCNTASPCFLRSSPGAVLSLPLLPQPKLVASKALV